ncbi:unnamed protein product [Aureobasidium vineae]|uniref:Alkaline phosphatase n=1 Tax=Aureobasidium vineae TaxID=2773715 RepID=A0A9N8JK19_9PEZI|nr:unnamed protein product [Aureobasidium vineae]
MFLSLVTVASLALAATASWDDNINFNSHSLQHRDLGLDIAKTQKRTGLVARRTANFSDRQLNFTHGVASGDPYPKSVILWTRLAHSLASDRSNVTVSGDVEFYNHETEEYIRASKHKVCTQWRIASDANLTCVVDESTVYTTSDIDFTIKTSPSADQKIDNIGLAVHSCSYFPNGYSNAYGNAARKDRVDYVIHLGDYIYESSVGVQGRDARATIPSRALLNLYDYRTRIAQYRTDDDHEVANNGYRDGFSAMNNTEDSFVRSGGVSVDQRKINAVRAYFEWLPIRQVNMDDNLRIWRNFQMGTLLDLTMLDTRNYDRSITDLNYIYNIHNDAERSLMGSQQEDCRVNITSWFGTFENPYNEDQWDGYQANRNRTSKTLYDHDIGNNIMLAGDSHANWVSDLVWLDEHPYNSATGEDAVGVEFAGTAVTSSGFGGTIRSANNQSSILVRDNAELQWNEGYYRGYFELQVGYDAVHASYYGMPTVASRNPLEISLANFTVLNSGNKLQRPVAGGKVESGYIKTGQVQMTNLTYNTQNQSWAVRNDFNQMFISFPRTT